MAMVMIVNPESFLRAHCVPGNIKSILLVPVLRGGGGRLLNLCSKPYEEASVIIPSSQIST